jgi:hypothetical protein
LAKASVARRTVVEHNFLSAAAVNEAIEEAPQDAKIRGIDFETLAGPFACFTMEKAGTATESGRQ